MSFFSLRDQLGRFRQFFLEVNRTPVALKFDENNEENITEDVASHEEVSPIKLFHTNLNLLLWASTKWSSETSSTPFFSTKSLCALFHLFSNKKNLICTKWLPNDLVAFIRRCSFDSAQRHTKGRHTRAEFFKSRIRTRVSPPVNREIRTRRSLSQSVYDHYFIGAFESNHRRLGASSCPVDKAGDCQVGVVASWGKIGSCC